MPGVLIDSADVPVLRALVQQHRSRNRNNRSQRKRWGGVSRGQWLHVTTTAEEISAGGAGEVAQEDSAGDPLEVSNPWSFIIPTDTTVLILRSGGTWYVAAVDCPEAE